MVEHSRARLFDRRDVTNQCDLEMKPILRANDIHKSYRTGRTSQLEVLKGITFDVMPGEIVALVGPSGVGKSTLLHLIGILDRPNIGTIEIDGVNVFAFNDTELAQLRNKTIGFVFQAHHLLPEFTALENVMLPSLIARCDSNDAKKNAMKLLQAIGLTERAQHRPNELSGGEQQRVAVARALVNQPRLLLADEPSGNLDLNNARLLHELLWKLSRELNQTMIIVTHNYELAKMADRNIELYDGRIKNSIYN